MSLSEKALLLKEDFDGVYNKGYDKGYSWGEEVGYHNGLAKGEEVGYQNGYSMGYSEGNDEGYARGRTTGIEIGKQEEYDAFWDIYQKNGVDSASIYGSAYFGECWSDTLFKPKYDIILNHNESALRLFYRSSITNIHKTLMDRGLKIVVGEKAKTMQSMFELCDTEEIPPLETGNITNFYGFANSDGRNKLKKVHKLNLSSATNVNYVFNNQKALTDITFEGVIPISISFQHSPLSVASLKNVITHLKDYTGTNEYSYTVTFKSSAFAELEKEGATSPNGNTWAEYIDDLKWNLVKA